MLPSVATGRYGVSLAGNADAAPGPARVGRALPEPAVDRPAPTIHYVSEVPAKCWNEVTSHIAGTQSYTAVRIGDKKYEMMLDGGAGLSTIPEDI